MKGFKKNRCDNPEVDPYLIGTGWAQDDLGKPQILLESTAGDSHPGSRHLKDLVEAAGNGVYKAGGKPAAYTITDICDGLATGHAGMNYSLDDPYNAQGGLRVLSGNLAPDGAVVKRAAISEEMQRHTGSARPFDSEADAIAAIQKGSILPGDVIIIRYEGPRGGRRRPVGFRRKGRSYFHRYPWSGTRAGGDCRGTENSR